MAFDPSRLYTGLLNTGLQTKDNPLYQVIHNLIDGLSLVSKQTSSVINSGSNVTNITQRIYQGLQGDDGSDGEIGVPGIAGLQGLTGLQGPPGIDGDVYEDSFFRPNPSIQDLISNFTPGSVIFAGASGFLAQDNANLFYNVSTHQLGLGGSPSAQLDILSAGNGNGTNIIRVRNSDIKTLYGVQADGRIWYGGNIGSNALVSFNRGGAFLGGNLVEFNDGTNTIAFVTGTRIDASAATLAFNTSSGSNSNVIFLSGANVGFGLTVPTAIIHLKAGTASANTAPVKLTSGTVLTTPESGTIEYDGTNFYLTP